MKFHPAFMLLPLHNKEIEGNHIEEEEEEEAEEGEEGEEEGNNEE